MAPSESGLHVDDTSVGIGERLGENEQSVWHRTYYIPSGDVVFKVEDTLYRVHRYFFERESALFRDMLSLPVPNQQLSSIAQEHRPSALCKEGLSDEYPIRLPQVKSDEFEAFLWVFYNPTYSEYDAPAATWTSILRLAHLWDFQVIKDLAFRHLENEPPAKRLVLGERYDAPAAFRSSAMTELVTREEPLSRDEGEELGITLVLEIAALREKVRAGRDGRRKNRFGNYYVPRSRSRSRTRSRSRSPPQIIVQQPVPPHQPPILVPPPQLLFVHPPPGPPEIQAVPFDEDEDWNQAQVPGNVEEGRSTSKMRRMIRFFKKALRRG